MINKIRMLFLIFIPIITIAVWNGNATSIEIKLPLLQILVSAIILLLSISILNKKEIQIYYDFPLLVTIIFLFSCIYAYWSTIGMSLNHRAAMPQLYGIITFLVVYGIFKKEHLNKLIEIISYTSIFVSVYGILQFFKMDPIDWVVVSDRLRVISFFGHKNYFALYLLIVIPLNIYLSVIEQNKIKDILFKIASFCSILALGLSYSRGALASFFIFGTVSYILYLNRKRADNFKIKTYVYFVPLIILVILPFIMPVRIKEDIANLYKKKELNTRLVFWKGALEISSRSAKTGVGPGNFRNEYPLNSKFKIHSYSPNQVVDHVHNDFLEIYLEYGLITLALYILIITSFLVRFWRGYHQKDRKKEEYLLLLAIFCGVISFVAYSTVTVAARYVSSLYYFWIAIAIGEIVLENRSKKLTISIESLKIKLPVFLFIIVISLFSGTISVKRYWSSHLVHKSQNHMRRKSGTAKDALVLIDKAIKLDPKNIEAIYAKGYASFMIGNLKNAKENYQQIYRIYPAYVNIAFNLASCYYKENNWIEALFYAKESFKQYPGYTPNGVMLGYCYYYLRDPEKAYNYCRMILERDPENQGALNLMQKLSAIEEGGLYDRN